MSEYNFDDDDKGFGETIRLDKIKQHISEVGGIKNEIHDTVEIYPIKEKKKDKNDVSQAYEGISNISEEFPEEKEKNNKKSKPMSKLGGGKNGAGATGMPNQYKMFISLAVVVGVVAFLSVFIMSYFSTRMSMKPGKEITEKLPEGDKPGDTHGIAEGKAEKFFYAVVKDVSGSRIELLNIDDKTNHIMKAHEGLNVQNISPGEMIYAEVSKDGKTLMNAETKDDIWKKSGITNISVDEGVRTIKSGTDSYTYSKDAIFMYDGKTITPAQLDKPDIITVYGREKTVWSVTADSVHGYIKIKNKDKIKGVQLYSDDKKLEFDEDGRAAVVPGAHKVQIKGSNIDTIDADILVSPNQDYEIDLAAIQAKTGVLVIKTNVDGCSLTINGDTYSIDSPIVLNHGNYNIKITKDGYTPWEQGVNLDKAVVDVMAELVSEKSNSEIETPVVIPEPKTDEKISRVTISSTPSGGSIYLDDEYIGMAPVMKNIEYGKHTIIIKADGFIDAEKTIDVNAPNKDVLIKLTEE